MAMRATHSEWTVDMLDALPDDGNRYEIIDGTLFVTPAPSDVHQLVVGAMHARVRAYLRPDPSAERSFRPPTSGARIGDATGCSPTCSSFASRIKSGRRIRSI